MPAFQPFAGLRYDPVACSLAEVIAPPYDVVGERERACLAARSPYNAVHVELPSPDEAHGQDRYAHAASLLERWERDGVLRRDDAEALYLYRMRFVDEDGAARSTTGAIGALGVGPLGSDVLPHEQTMPKPTGDRLDLLRACRANLSPIWGLSLATGLGKACADVAASSPSPLAATDDEGVVHELWPVTDAASIERITGLVESAPVIIADGHHRFETARQYQAERRAANGGAPGAYDLVMALVVELSPDELVVGAIHRLVAGLPPRFSLLEHLEAHFEPLPIPGDSDSLVEAMRERGGLGLVTEDGSHLLLPRPALEAAAAAPLDSSRLDVALANLPPHRLVYQHSWSLAADAVHRGEAQAAFLLRPATIEQIAQTAHGDRRMPPKTTFFHPKPRTGMVYRPVPG
ncbi:MAG TPA: DUF1015 domain-containing protein [Acidimicrobiales bacterium]|nr:DUF1015 domain-containing protein [Acidimicrobiales bacterium]